MPASNAPSGGSPLDSDARLLMESRFGADFGAVRIHTNAAAGRLSRTLGAQAFTAGQHVFFAPGEYKPVWMSWAQFMSIGRGSGRC